MAIENFGDYTEVDEQDVITVTSNKIDFANSNTRTYKGYVYKDKGENHFDGDFEHLIEFYESANEDYSLHGIWTLANMVGDLNEILGASESALLMYLYSDAEVFKLLEFDSGSQSEDVDNYSLSTLYYVKVSRDDDAGTYGTLYCYVYDDAERTNLIFDLAVPLNTSKKDFQYIYGHISYDDNKVQDPIETGYQQNFDLQEAVGISIPVVMKHLREQGIA